MSFSFLNQVYMEPVVSESAHLNVGYYVFFQPRRSHLFSQMHFTAYHVNYVKQDANILHIGSIPTFGHFPKHCFLLNIPDNSSCEGEIGHTISTIKVAEIVQIQWLVTC